MTANNLFSMGAVLLHSADEDVLEVGDESGEALESLGCEGLVRQEQVALETFLDNRFGQCYASESVPVSRPWEEPSA